MPNILIWVLRYHETLYITNLMEDYLYEHFNVTDTKGMKH